MVADRTNAGDNETQMLPWLQHGPLSVSIAAGALNGCEYTVSFRLCFIRSKSGCDMFLSPCNTFSFPTK